MVQVKVRKLYYYDPKKVGAGLVVGQPDTAEFSTESETEVGYSTFLHYLRFCPHYLLCSSARRRAGWT